MSGGGVNCKGVNCKGVNCNLSLDLLYSARAFLHFIESVHFILYILAIYILVIKITCTIVPTQVDKNAR